jgi:hypothetical protein
MNSHAEYCRQRAIECDRIAARATDQSNKQKYFGLAERWREIASQADELARREREAAALV